jgi:hypothetical protein
MGVYHKVVHRKLNQYSKYRFYSYTFIALKFEVPYIMEFQQLFGLIQKIYLNFLQSQNQQVLVYYYELRYFKV